MISSNIEISHGVENPGAVENKGKDASSLRSVSKGSIISPDLNNAESVRLRSDQKSFSNRQSVNSKLNSIAKSIRTADDTMREIAGQISKIKEKLTEIVKHYPPFLAGSDERVEMKKGFDAFKTLIDKLTFPPKEDDIAAGILSASNLDRESGFFKATLDDKGLDIKISEQESDVPKINIDIPVLPESATDEEIKVVIEKLNIAENTLINRRAALFSDAAAISGLVNETSIVVKINPTFGEELKNNEIDETAARLRSAEVREDLKKESSSFTDSGAQIMQLLR